MWCRLVHLRWFRYMPCAFKHSHNKKAYQWVRSRRVNTLDHAIFNSVSFEFLCKFTGARTFTFTNTCLDWIVCTVHFDYKWSRWFSIFMQTKSVYPCFVSFFCSVRCCAGLFYLFLFYYLSVDYFFCVSYFHLLLYLFASHQKPCTGKRKTQILFVPSRLFDCCLFAFFFFLIPNFLQSWADQRLSPSYSLSRGIFWFIVER